jgi:hypothetical protein
LQPRLGTIEPSTFPRASTPTPMPSVVVGAFPIAPREWLPVPDPVPPPPVLRHWRNIKIGAVVILAMIVLVAVIFSGGAPQPAATPPADAANVNRAPMTVTVPADAADAADAAEVPNDAAIAPPDAHVHHAKRR